jgi:phage tail tape-measure protein
MSRKFMILLGMTIGSIAGGYIPTLLGANAFSVTSLFGSAAGGILGIWLAFKLSR